MRTKEGEWQVEKLRENDRWPNVMLLKPLQPVKGKKDKQVNEQVTNKKTFPPNLSNP